MKIVVQDISVEDDITLGQFLKNEGVIGTGGQAKWFLQDEEVLINGEREIRRGKKLHDGDLIEIPSEGKFRINHQSE
ncbi:S4 domain-containing protein YaaA [Mammaliicoccus fleurettii]|uniref:S4 domain-containing protein YaaA n=1 Tax=Mammaliicoccus TaxID=2803850 RepID=UPI001EFBAE8B|nr:S4 domain-containing protein YaaA [Mammaliicoccus fleurettii]MDT3994251.1 S4 domain-containing protein YaaA [Mammaliicoccus fleurettii]MEB6200946.1 S4 domain-containing protein YaaA [Mammaliicoccus fleurettii]MEB7725408.1 S4 domain-containing protein YaaA [Mammaliicoccus fleurettii]MEB7780823.1 S4 domain-containing protein YaaA [Mammaliicoccus fleurettii]MEB7805769.1 S4 domain-containing protein YaaA [Mammaliicoccus fleurettii]